jgi:homoserine dehydrogenase
MALVGFGNVGRALVHLLEEKKADLFEKYQITYSITGIATSRHGMAINPDGIDPQEALHCVEVGESLVSLSKQPVPKDMISFIRECPAEVLFENSPVNYETGQPAIDHLRTALECGMHAITANKGPVVHAYKELTELAESKELRFFHESAVMDGAPIFSLFRGALPAARLRAFRGILNSTTNLILTRMENGQSFDDAVSYAQKIGIAETDPSGDVDGWDAAVKVAALVTVLMDYPLKPQQVQRTGLRGITPEDIAKARLSGQRWKLVCSAQRTKDGVEAKVAPELVSPSSPMYSVENTTSIVEFETDVLGLLSVVESDPGPNTTAYGLLADFLNAVHPA